MIGRGRVAATAATYVSNLRACADAAGDAQDVQRLIRRLIGDELAPNSLRTNLAALRAWAKFAKDAALSSALEDLRLPPARRVRTKMPLSDQDLRRFVRYVASEAPMSDAMRQVILIMALRGLRSGDVLRIRRPEVIRAIATGKLIYEGKGRKRIEFAAAPIRAQLDALSKITGWDRVRDLIVDSENPKVAAKAVWRAVRRAAQAVGIDDMHPHRLRHTFATRYLKQLEGNPNAIKWLQKYMDWESPATAMRYVDAVSQDELDAVGAGLMSDILPGARAQGERRRQPR